MEPPLDIDPKRTALLVMDCQESTMPFLPIGERERVLRAIQQVASECRRAGLLVIYVYVQFRRGYPEISERNAVFMAIKKDGRLQEGEPGTQICSQIAPQPGDIVLTKKRISAFAGSDLEVVLRSKGIDTLVLCGVSSTGCVESTARFAVDMDYRVIVLADSCADLKGVETHQIAMKVLLPRIAIVCSNGVFLGVLRS